MKNQHKPIQPPGGGPRPQRPPLPLPLPPLAPSSPEPPAPKLRGNISADPPIPILVPVSPGRPGVWAPTSGRPTARPAAPAPKLAPKLAPTPRLETRVASLAPPASADPPPARPKDELIVTLRLQPDPAALAANADTRILRRPNQDTPTEFIPRMTLDERRKRLLELLLEVEAKLEMMDDPVPY